MRYFAKLISGAPSNASEKVEPTAIEVEPLGGNGGVGRYRVRLGDETHEVDALALDHGAVSVLLDGESFNAEFDEHGDEISVLLRGGLFRVDIADERRMRLRAGEAELTVEGRVVLAAPMPGKVVKVLTKVGDEVEAGQGLVVMEAMKMENELKSPKAGKVVELTAREGDAVEHGAKLVVVE